MATKARLLEIAAALDEEAHAAEWLAGLARGEGDTEKADQTLADAATMSRYAGLNRAVADEQDDDEG